MPAPIIAMEAGSGVMVPPIRSLPQSADVKVNDELLKSVRKGLFALSVKCTVASISEFPILQTNTTVPAP